MTTESATASSAEPRNHVPRRRRGLESQLLSGFALAVTLPMVALAVIGGFSYVRRERAEATYRLEEAARGIRTQMWAHLSLQTRALTSLAGAIQESGHLDPPTLNRWLARYHASNPDFLAIALADAEGRLVATHPLAGTAAAS
ncbi:MAG: hypothetical protein ACRD08_08200, partial [Acidimicrobiales bacterium]